jgi:dihydrofolate reductase
MAHRKVVGGMALSLDGFIQDKDGSVAKLYPDMKALQDSAYLQDSMRETGAVVMGRRAYDMANGDFTGYEYQVPIFVATHHAPEPPKGQNDRLRVTYVPDGVESAVAQAKSAAGDKDVTVVGGASTIRQCLDAALLDELHLLIAPVLLGDGLRLFETRQGVPVNFEQLAVDSYTGFTILKYRPR